MDRDLKKIVNIMPDDKFLDYYIQMSEKFIPGKSSYIVFSDNEQLRFIKTQSPDLIILTRTEPNFQEVLEKLKDVKVVIFHSFQNSLYSFIQKVPKSIKKIWVFWGFDGYGALPKNSFLRTLSSLASYKKSIVGYVKFGLNLIMGSVVTKSNKRAREIIRQMDYCATWIDADYELAKTFNSQIKHLPFNYYTRELMETDSADVEKINVNKLLLGNSASPNNNHIEALKYLGKIKFKGEIVCSLSYSGTKTYVDNVCKLGEQLFGANFIPLRDFMPLNEYHEIINSCGVVWMNHKRQQAAGNLLVSFIGQKIIIVDSINPMKTTFSRWGLTLFDKTILTNLGSVSSDSLIKNREIVNQKMTINQNEFFFNTIVELQAL